MNLEKEILEMQNRWQWVNRLKLSPQFWTVSQTSRKMRQDCFLRRWLPLLKENGYFWSFFEVFENSSKISGYGGRFQEYGLAEKATKHSYGFFDVFARVYTKFSHFSWHNLTCQRIVVRWALFPFRFSLNLEVLSSQGLVPWEEISILHLLLLLCLYGAYMFRKKAKEKIVTGRYIDHYALAG